MFNTRLQWAAYAVLPDSAWHLCLGTSHVTLVKEDALADTQSGHQEKWHLGCDAIEVIK